MNLNSKVRGIMDYHPDVAKYSFPALDLRLFFKRKFYPKWWVFTGDFMWHKSFHKNSPKLQQIPESKRQTRGAWKQISANSSVTFSSASNTNLPNLRCTTGGGNFCTVVGRSSWWSRDASYICRNGRNVRKYEPLEAWKPSRLLK